MRLTRPAGAHGPCVRRHRRRARGDARRQRAHRPMLRARAAKKAVLECAGPTSTTAQATQESPAFTQIVEPCGGSAKEAAAQQLSRSGGEEGAEGDSEAEGSRRRGALTEATGRAHHGGRAALDARGQSTKDVARSLLLLTEGPTRSPEGVGMDESQLPRPCVRHHDSATAVHEEVPEPSGDAELTPTSATGGADAIQSGEDASVVPVPDSDEDSSLRAT